MSNLDNLRKVFKRKVHRERPQPADRKHLGFMQRKSDYKIRAKNRNERKQKIKALKQQAAFRNPDEFYHKMIRSNVTDSGKSVYQEDEHLSESQLDLLRTQNLNYISLVRNQESKQIEKLQSSLHFLSDNAPPQNKHTVFLSDDEEAEDFDPVKYFDTVPELITRTYNRPRIETLKTTPMVLNSDAPPPEIVSRAANRKYTELAARLNREKKLKDVEDASRTQKELQKGESCTNVSQKGKMPVYKWKRERKR
eukprot:TRINITY_DN8273_c0_g1_i1.p1 TRINITY_DN8273_c0_g1~~TRINITY_DN8273_c0_g1_i1.p1  ORF type:complete len:252 (+),score=47.32 TRINITY_DN8273_c0_g1_i1:150-905(+)